MEKTARFGIAREKTLGQLFTTDNLSSIWRKTVKYQMRGMDILDLHDYYDFNSNIKEKAKEIRSQILKAQYRASSPLVYRLEKRYGICRRLMIPSPSDALVFQTVTEYLAGPLIAAQPTNKAYYSRDKHSLKLPHHLKTPGDYWFILWPKFQKDIWKFTNACPFLVVTDITDFFDNIGLRELRHIVSSITKIDEVVLDLLFNIIEQISWVPDYLPSSLKGLPTINLEAFRLLPHVMLFEIDQVLDFESHGNFVRWMDDINVGVNSPDEAFAVLKDVNDVLKSRGLALNVSKTRVYTSDEAKQHFMFDENTYLDAVAKANTADASFKNARVEFLKRFRSHCAKTELKNWDKVTKRYFSVASALKITELRRYIPKLFRENPGIRGDILRYLSRLTFSTATSEVLLELLTGVKRYDDVSLFQFCKCITDMEIPRTKRGIEFVRAVDKALSRPESSFDLYCYIWFLAKYGAPHRLMNTIFRTEKSWRNEQFLARQITSVLPRVFNLNQKNTRRLLDEQMTAGPRDAASVATTLSSLLDSKWIVGGLHAYLFPPAVQKPYPLPKYLILTSVLSSRSLKPAEKVRASAKILQIISDPWYLHWLNHYSLLG
jgi:hypothetical protein